MLAKIFAAFLRGKINFEIFRRLAAGIDSGAVDDLKEFAKIKPPPAEPPQKQDPLTRILHTNLVRTGFVGLPNFLGITPITGVSLVITEMGKSFQMRMNHN